MGTQVKLDIASPILTPAINNWQMQHYEVAVNVRLAKRWYPTAEIGYAGGKYAQDSIAYSGHGAFLRIGCDINPLKRHPELPHALLVGLRFGTAVQGYTQETALTGSSSGIMTDSDRNMYRSGVQADCWGEIVAGCQVEIAKVHNTAFYMGWMGRFKFLFTRKTMDKNYHPYAIYIPGFGHRDNIGWGVNYYLGWKF